MHNLRYEFEDSKTAEGLRHDARWKTLRHGLNQLTLGQLRRIVNHTSAGGNMLYDSFNYDEDRGLWCPLAVGLAVPAWVEIWDDPLRITNERAKRIILMVGRKWVNNFSLNPMSGIAGKFYKNNRAADVALLCRLLILERERKAGAMSNERKVTIRIFQEHDEPEAVSAEG